MDISDEYVDDEDGSASDYGGAAPSIAPSVSTSTYASSIIMTLARHRWHQVFIHLLPVPLFQLRAVIEPLVAFFGIAMSSYVSLDHLAGAGDATGYWDFQHRLAKPNDVGHKCR